MTTAAKRAGAQFETDVVGYLRERGLSADRLAKAGKLDEGDVVFEADNIVVVAELKVRRDKNSALNLGAWLAEAEVEGKHYAAARNLLNEPLTVLIVKRPNKGIGQAFVVLTLEDFIAED